MIKIFVLFIFLFSSSDKDIEHYQKSKERILKEYFEQGMKYYRESQIEQAKSCFEKMLAIDSKNKDAKNILTQIEREKIIIKDDEPFKEMVKQLFEKGISFYRKEDWKNANKCFNEAYNLNPKNEKVKEFLDETNIKLKPKNIEEKIEEEKIINTPTIEKHHHKKISTQKKIPPKEEKIDEKEKKKLIDTLYRKGLKYYQQKKYKDALSCFEQVLQLDPKNEKTLNAINSLKSEMKK